MADDLTLSTAPTSKRFPTTNQAKACYMYYNSWHQCKYDYSDEEPQCAKLKGWAMSMCPIEWVRAPPHTPLPRAAGCARLLLLGLAVSILVRVLGPVDRRLGLLRRADRQVGLKIRMHDVRARED